jgi:VanZ family protein
MTKSPPATNGADLRWLAVWAAAVAFFLLAPPSLLPGFGAASARGLDKVGHFLLFFALAWLALEPARARTPHPLLVAGGASVAYGALLEVLQGLSGWRSAELGDVVADGIGSFSGVIAPWLWRRA